MGVSPFRNLRVNGYVLLTAAYRSLSRLSSALSAKASTLRSSSLYLSALPLGKLGSAASYIALYECAQLTLFCFFLCYPVLDNSSDVLNICLFVCMQFSRYIMS